MTSDDTLEVRWFCLWWNEKVLGRARVRGVDGRSQSVARGETRRNGVCGSLSTSTFVVALPSAFLLLLLLNMLANRFLAVVGCTGVLAGGRGVEGTSIGFESLEPSSWSFCMVYMVCTVLLRLTVKLVCVAFGDAGAECERKRKGKVIVVW